MEKSEPQNSSFQQEKDVVPLGSYVLALAAWWRESLLGMILAGVGGAGLLLTAELILPRYESFCDVALIPTEANISIDDTLRMATTSKRARRVEVEARREGLLGLVHNGSVAMAVAERLGDRWDEKKPRAAELLEQIHARMVVSVQSQNRYRVSDLVRITARADGAEKAAALADAWAAEYVKHVNVLYQQVPENVLRGVAGELTTAREAYAAAQQKLGAFVANNPVPQLERIIAEKKEVLENAQKVRTAATDAHFSRIRNQFEGTSALESILTDGRNSTLRERYETLRILHRLKKNAHALRLQIEVGGERSVGSNHLPLLLIKAEAYGSLSKLSDTLHINLNGAHPIHANSVEQKADLDALIESMEDLYAKTTLDVEKIITVLLTSENAGENDSSTPPSHIPSVYDGLLQNSFRLNSPSAGKKRTLLSLDELTFEEHEVFLPALEKEIQELEAEKEEAAAVLRSLTLDRDIQHSALEGLQNESVELQLTRASASAQVRLAAQAVPATDTIYPSPLLIAFLSGSAGLLAMMGFALAANGVGVRPPLGRRGPLRSKKRGDDR